ncbi:hypothetical protein ACL2XO_16575 [Sodalis sp. RH15]|uniref:hypothetical protein n=1 Tax=Sodalis sp. RH15 TaxID=3394330 RepID=UPI0039B61533
MLALARSVLPLESKFVSVQKIEGLLAQTYISNASLPFDHPQRSVVPRKQN